MTVTLNVFAIIILLINFFIIHYINKRSDVIKKWQDDVQEAHNEYLVISKKLELNISSSNYELNLIAFSLFYQAEFVKSKLIYLLDTMESSYANINDIDQVKQNIEYLVRYTDNVRNGLLKNEVSSPYIKYDAFQEGLGDNKFSKN